MKAKIFFKFFFFGIILGFCQSFVFLIPVIIFVYYFFLKNIYKFRSTSEGFFSGWIFGTGFFVGSMHWMVNPFLVYEKHFFLIPLGLLVFPLLMGLFFLLFLLF